MKHLAPVACAVVALGLVLLCVDRPWHHAAPPTVVRAAPAPTRSTPPPPPLSLAAKPTAPTNARVHQLLSELTAKHPFGPARQKALRNILPYLSPAEIRAALDETFGNDACNDMTHVLLERLATVDSAGALAFAREHAFGLSPPWWLSVVGGLSQPQTALPDLLKLPGGDERTSFISYAVGRWATTDRAAALDYALNAAPAESRQLALANAIMFAAHDDHAAGFDLALKYANQINDPNFVQQLATDWASRDFNAALDRVRTLSDSDVQQHALRGVAAIAVTRDPDSARTLIAQVDDESARAELYRQVAMQWLHRDPTAARSWLASTDVISDADKRIILDPQHFGQTVPAATP